LPALAQIVMAANQKIEFTISAVDKATRTIDRINRSVANMTRPYANLAKSIKRFSEASGLTTVAKRLDTVAQKAAKATTSLTKMAAPLLALVGGGTLAGLSEMVTHWERIGAETERTSRLLGITAGQLVKMRGAAALMGVSSDTMTAGFQSLADTLQDARWGRNQAAFSTLQSLGITLRSTASGAVDTKAAMYDLADRMKRIQQRDPAAARNLARSLGVEQLLPVLVQGREGMRAYEAEAVRLRGEFTPGMGERAQAFTLSLSKMALAADGLRQSIADRLAPMMQPFIDRLTEWIAKNRELISQRIGALVQRIADALDRVDLNRLLDDLTKAVSAIMDFVGWVTKAVEALGGWKAVAVIVATYMAGGFVASIASVVVSIAMLGGRVWKLARAWGGAGKAATTAAEAISGAGAAAEGAAGRGLLGRMLGGALRFVNPWTAGAYLLGHSGDLNTGEDEQLKRIRAAEQAAGGQWPGAGGSQPTGGAANAALTVGAAVRNWAAKLDFGGTEKRYGLPAGLLSAMAQQESRGNAGAVSPAGAAGLFQFMPGTAREYGINAFDPAQSANAAARKMAGLLSRYHGNLTAALSAYNWGEGNLERKGMANAPAETRNYAPEILARMASLGSGDAVPSLNAPAQPDGGAQAAPVVHVHNQVHVARDGGVTVRTQTPGGLKIERPMVSPS
jgi:hypothetical protein